MPSDISAYRTLRLAALLDVPSAFSATVESEQALSDEHIISRIVSASFSGIWGARNRNGVLVGIAGMLHQPQAKLQHKAAIYTVYVAPCARQQGVARQLLQSIIHTARCTGVIRQLTLGVTSNNLPALRLYHSLGFVAFGTEPQAICVNGVYHDEVWLQLSLHVR